MLKFQLAPAPVPSLPPRPPSISISHSIDLSTVYQGEDVFFFFRTEFSVRETRRSESRVASLSLLLLLCGESGHASQRLRTRSWNRFQHVSILVKEG